MHYLLSKRAGWCFLVIALAAQSGCGTGDERPFRNDSNDSERYAGRIKNNVLQELLLIPQARDPTNSADALVNELGQYQAHPVGEYKETYADLLEVAQQLREHFEGGGSVANAKGLMADMKQLAESLPGDVWAGGPLHD